MCRTKYPELWNALAAPFHPDNVKQRTSYDYITARTLMNRLDEVIGPENWWDDYTPLEHGFLCRLTLRLPDGQLLTKVDSGADSSTLKDAGDADKGGMADAFKRAGVKFGVFRYGYKDGQVVHGVPDADAISAGRGSPDPAPPPARRAIVGPAVAPRPAPAGAPATAPAGAPAGASAGEVIPPKKLKPEIKTGLQLYRFTETCRIDRDLLRWIIATFDKFPSKVSLWSTAQVAYALPEIKEHLEQVKAAKVQARR